MHIPDGYLSPRTCIALYAGMASVWYLASRKLERTLKFKQMPLLSLGAAFTFVVMMFNIPIPGGSTGHIVGSSIVAIVLGPWAGVVAISLALTLQALFFGDGGLTTLGANCFNMAFLMSFTGYYAWRAVNIGGGGRTRNFIASAVAGYISVNVAALAVAFELGVQPALSHDALGRPLYAPYPLGVTMPAMMFSHLLFFGPVEAMGTALVVSYLYGAEKEVLKRPEGRGLKPLWAVLILLIVLTPLGLIATGTPWGEWGKGELRGLLGYVPEGMESLGEAWQGILPGYGIGGGGGSGVFGSAFGYILSAAVGSALVVFTVYMLGRFWHRR